MAPHTPTPVEQFLSALNAGDIDSVRRLLREREDVRAAVNAPISHFKSRPVERAKKNLPLLDVLLAHGADLNLKSEWWAGGFGVLEYDCTPDEAAPLVARGAIVDVFAASHLSMFDRLKDLVDRDPALIAARGGDGKTALHCAQTVEVARYLIDRGAGIDVRDVDHESTPAQYLVREAPDVVRLLVERGAWFDIFIAIGLRDAALVERCLRGDFEALDHRAGQGLYSVAHKNDRPATAEEIGPRRGDIYRWVFGHNVSAIEAAVSVGDRAIVAQLFNHASPAQRILAACASADRAAAQGIVGAHPGIVETLSGDQMRLLSYRAYANDTAAVSLMLDLGFDPLARGSDGWEALRWAAFHGNAGMVSLLLGHAPPINVPDPTYGGTVLGQCLYGSLHGWTRNTGDFATTVRLLLEAGERLDPAVVPIGREDVDAALRDYLSARRA